MTFFFLILDLMLSVSKLLPITYFFAHISLNHVCFYAISTIRFVVQWGCTVLMQAVDNGHTEVCRLLLDHGADVNVADSVRASKQSIQGYLMCY